MLAYAYYINLYELQEHGRPVSVRTEFILAKILAKILHKTFYYGVFATEMAHVRISAFLRREDLYIAMYITMASVS